MAFFHFQYGFSSPRLTTDFLAVVSDRIARAFNWFEATWAVALDISKAFDIVWNAGLLHKLKVGLLRSKKILPNENFRQSFSKKYYHFFVGCLKMKINKFWNSKFCFLEKQADLKTKCTGLRRFIPMIIYNMVTQIYYLCWWFKSIFEIMYSFWLMSWRDKPIC